MARNLETIALFKRTVGSFLWTGFEPSNPLLNGERWDQSALVGFYDPTERKRQLELMTELGIQNARIALPNHLVASAYKRSSASFEEPISNSV